MDLEYLGDSYGELKKRVKDDIKVVDKVLCPTSTGQELRELADKLEAEESLNRRADPFRKFAKVYCERRLNDLFEESYKGSAGYRPADD